MASCTDDKGSSDDEILSAIKRKANEKYRLNFNEKKSKYCADSDESEKCDDSDSTYVEDAAKSISPSNSMINEPSTSQPKNQKRKFYCLQCESVFESNAELRSHAAIHQVETSYKCEECGRCFSKAFSLKMHKKFHEVREIKCPLCDQVFTQKSNLGIHLMSHERQEQCPSCPDKFHTKEQLRIHSRSHNSPRGLRHRAKKDLKKSKESAKKDAVSLKTKRNDVNEFENCLKRHELNHETECAIVCKMHKGRSIYDICKLYNVTPEVVNQIWEDRDKFDIPKKNNKRTAKYFNNKLDTKVLEWFNEQRTHLKQVTGQMLQDKAEEIAKELSFVQFNGSKKWLDRFKTRYKITLRGQQVKRDLPNPPFESKWKKAFFKDQWCDARLGFTDDNIYTADEVGIYFNPSMGRIKKQGGKKFVHGYVKDRLSIFMCTNATGTDKKKLLVCGFEDPLIHSHRDPDTLPVNYIRHSQAHFTTKMFEEYVKYWNRELQRLDRKVLLILDRATIHTKLQLSHLKLCFVPWKGSGGLIPIRNGIYAKFRDEFRRLLLQEKAIKIFKGVDRNSTCMEALYMIEKAWERTPPEIILKSFISIGYDVGMDEYYDYRNSVATPKVKENDEEEICEMLKDFDVEPYFTDLPDLDMYLTVDEELVTGQGTNISVFGGNHKDTDPDPLAAEKEKEEILPISSEKPETDERENVVKRNRAIEDLEIVRNYLRTTNTSYKMYCNFMDIENFLFKTPM